MTDQLESDVLRDRMLNLRDHELINVSPTADLRDNVIHAHKAAQRRKQVLFGASGLIVAAAVVTVAAAVLSGGEPAASDKSEANRAGVSAPASSLGIRPAPSAANQIDIAAKLDKVGSRDPAFVSVKRVDKQLFIVYRTDTETSVLKAEYQSAVGKGLSIKFEQALLSNSQVKHLDDVVSQNVTWLERHGVHLQEWGAGTPGPYVLGYTSTSRPSKDLLARFEIYGKGTVKFEKVQTIHK